MKAELHNELASRKEQGLYRQRRIIDAAQGAMVKSDEIEYINFSSNDYLGLANNEELKLVFKHAINEYGIGAGSSQLLTGHNLTHRQLEKTLANFLNRDQALVFSSGYHANLAIGSTLINKTTVVLQDKLNHASLIDSALLSKGKLQRYRHNDIEHLEALLERNKDHQTAVMTDAVFSMDGDYALLCEIADLCCRYSALLIVDDAHGVGVLGKTGAGLLEQLGLGQNRVPLLIGTFGKAFGAYGAFIAGDDIYIEALIQKARTYIYTTALMPAVAATLNKSVEIIKKSDVKREKLKTLIAYYRHGVKKRNLKENNSFSQIQPLLVGDAQKTSSLSNFLLEKNILVPAIRPPTVPANTSRLRISITSEHTENQIDLLLSGVEEILENG